MLLPIREFASEPSLNIGTLRNIHTKAIHLLISPPPVLQLATRPEALNNESKRKYPFDFFLQVLLLLRSKIVLDVKRLSDLIHRFPFVQVSSTIPATTAGHAPLIISATVLHVRSSRGRMSR